MNKIKLLFYRSTDKISKKCKKFFLWMAGFRNIEDMIITCREGDYMSTFTMVKDQVIHKVISLRISIDEKL